MRHHLQASQGAFWERLDTKVVMDSGVWLCSGTQEMHCKLQGDPEARGPRRRQGPRWTSGPDASSPTISPRTVLSATPLAFLSSRQQLPSEHEILGSGTPCYAQAASPCVLEGQETGRS